MNKVDTKSILRTMREIVAIDNPELAHAQADTFLVQIFRGVCEQYMTGQELEDMNAFLALYASVEKRYA